MAGDEKYLALKVAAVQSLVTLALNVSCSVLEILALESKLPPGGWLQ